jgi:hypothetical protein
MATSPDPVAKKKYPLRIHAYMKDKEGKDVCIFSTEEIIEEQYYFNADGFKLAFLKKLGETLRIEMTQVFPGKDELG